MTEARLERAWPAAGAELPRTPVSHVAPGSATRSRRIRVAVLTGAALALLAGGAAVRWGGDDRPDTPVAAGAVPTTGTEPAVSGPEPVSPEMTAGPTGSVSASPSATAAQPSRSVSPTPSDDEGGLSVGTATRAPVRSAEPEPSVPDEEPPVYTAFYGYQADPGSGYAGTVQVVNAGGAAGGDWTVTLTVPGAEKVVLTSGNVRMSQSGSSVTFRPAGGAELQVGGSVTIGFTIDGVPGELPTGCAVNGSACA
ncbi:cellulose binding domain-containing protein [Actinoplanes aureus]|uniref:Cellulose binding domain-containing protein n=1 Tax=Actinoplanes aureus TaxID=2792083 RepID=A0A931CNQ5_9ACTN|nr:cellulose binding domain-containing protein [Actinoplanes aureus]MBG0568255.1 cellulose binding domain-containing protein [Actinoplanes aureus]